MDFSFFAISYIILAILSFLKVLEIIGVIAYIDDITEIFVNGEAVNLRRIGLMNASGMLSNVAISGELTQAPSLLRMSVIAIDSITIDRSH